MPRLYDHIDLRVPDLAEVRPFYEVLLPALGFTRKTEIPDWFQYDAAAPDDGPAAFFGLTESPGHVPNESRIAFWAESIVEVDRLAGIAAKAGARNVRVRAGKTKLTAPSFSKTPAAIAWKSATAPQSETLNSAEHRHRC
jgi:hypothetical protein